MHCAPLAGELKQPAGCRLYKHEEAANLVMQDVVHTIHVNEDLDAIWKLFSDILSESISHAKWHYLLLMYAYLLPSSPKGSFGLKDLYRILRSLYPKSGDDGLQKLLLQFRESGLVSMSHAGIGSLLIVRLSECQRPKQDESGLSLKTGCLFHSTHSISCPSRLSCGCDTDSRESAF
jgi:hypothetical protein